MITITLLLILALNLTTNTFLVSGGQGGTGKYLEINFTTINPADTPALLLSDTEVTALKVSSDQIFTYEANVDSTHSQKVGAGTVLLEASPDTAAGWVFSYFVIRGKEESNFADYKTEKYDVVDAVFDRLSYSVAASVVLGEGTISVDGFGNMGSEGTINVYHGESATFKFIPAEGYYVSKVNTNSDLSDPQFTIGPITDNNRWIEVEFELYKYDITVYVADGLGEIWLNSKLVADETNDVDNPALVPVSYGETPAFEFVPNISTLESYHLSSVLVDSETYADLVLSEFTQSYTFSEIKEAGHSLGVTFSLDGVADIPSGSDVVVFLSSFASLNFVDTVGAGSAFGDEILSTGPGDVVVWDITVDAVIGEQIIVALRYDDTGMEQSDEENLRMYRSDVDYELYLRVDFNGDGVVDGQDVKIVSNISKHPKFLPEPGTPAYQEYLALYDLNGDLAIDELDIHVVNQMKNVEWTDITYGPVDTVNNIIYGLTDHFSIFRGR